VFKEWVNSGQKIFSSKSGENAKKDYNSIKDEEEI